MHSFNVTAIGQLAKTPELIRKGENSYALLCLIGNDYAGRDDNGRAQEVVTSLWFVAFGGIGERLASHARKGDQLILEARIRASDWSDEHGERQYDYSFVVEDFRFGAPGRLKREEMENQRQGDRNAA